MIGNREGKGENVLAEGSEDKVALEHKFVRDVETFMREDLLVVQEDVQVN